METLLEMWPLLLALLAFGAYMSWSNWRKRRRDNESVDAALTDLAANFGGQVLHGADAGVRSGALSPMLHRQTTGLRALTTRRKPRPEIAVQFTTGPWQVRISEWSAVFRGIHERQETHYEHRIEISTAELAPLKLTERRHVDLGGRPIDQNSAEAIGDVDEAPVTVAQRQGQWVQAAIASPAGDDLAAFTTDHAAASRTLNDRATSWLVDRLYGTHRTLTFEAGLLYTTTSGRIDGGEVTRTVNTMLGLLECIPEAAPTRPAAEGENPLLPESPAPQEGTTRPGGLSKPGLVGMAIGGIALLVGLFGYGALNLFNGIAMATGLTEQAEVRIIGEDRWNDRMDRESPNDVGEYTLDGRTHQVALEEGEVGDVAQGSFPALPVDWLGFPDAPMTGSAPTMSIVAGLACFGLLAVPAWLVLGTPAKRRRTPVQQAVSPADPSGRPDRDDTM